MRNLRYLRQAIVPPPSDAPLAALCWDPATDDLLIAHGPSLDEPVVELFRQAHDPYSSSDGSSDLP